MFVLLSCATLAADLVSKHYAFRSLEDQPDLAKHVSHIRLRLREQFQRQIEQNLRPADQAEPTTRDILQALAVLDPYQHKSVIGVRMTLSTNPGVVFGLPMPRPLVAAATLLTIALVVYFFAAAGARAYWIHVAMALILGGALGNLYDRMFSVVALPGEGLEPIRYHVRDFIDCSSLNYPYVFNVADVWLVIGVTMLILHWLVTAGAPASAKRKADRTR